jgi:hypothetical protein
VRAAAITESSRALSDRSIPTDIGGAVTSVPVDGTRDELLIVDPADATRGVTGEASDPADVVECEHAAATMANANV